MSKPFLFKRGKYYHLQYFDETEQRKKRISTQRERKTDALKFLMEFEKMRDNIPQVRHILLSDFSKEYKQYIKANLSKGYLADTTTTFNKLIESTGDISIQKITSRMIEQFITGIFKESKHQARKHHATLRSAFNKAISWKYLSSNPLNGIKPPKVPKNNPIFIDENELNKILGKVDNPTLTNLYKLAFHTGMRLGEIVNLRWNQISFTDRLIRVTNTDDFTTKGKKERVIPINEKLLELLSNLLPKYYNLQNPGYVFNKNGFKFNSDYVSKQFKKAVRDTKNICPEFHFHDLRHSFASMLVSKGVSLYVVKELLGHSDFSTTQIYAHLQRDSLKEAIKILD